MTTDLTTQSDAALLEQVVVNNDLMKLKPAERLSYYRQLCASLDLNPLTRPFQYLTLSGRLTLYATKDATEQIRKRNKISIWKLEKETVNDIFIVTAYARDPEGREDSSTGAVPLPAAHSSEAIANAMMKAETKAKRRVTLSICGLGMLDESELDSLQTARAAFVDPDTGEILPPPDRGDSFPVPSAAALAGAVQGSIIDLSGDTPDEAEQRQTLIGAILGRKDALHLAPKDFLGYKKKRLGDQEFETAPLAHLKDLAGDLGWMR